jgi:hypothetical protein
VPLQEEHHELRPCQFASSCTLQTLNPSQQGLDLLDFSFSRRGVPRRQFRQAFAGIKGSDTKLVRRHSFLVLDVEPLLPLALN